MYGYPNTHTHTHVKTIVYNQPKQTINNDFRAHCQSVFPDKLKTICSSGLLYSFVVVTVWQVMFYTVI